MSCTHKTVGVVLYKLPVEDDISELKEMARKDEIFKLLIERNPYLTYTYASRYLKTYYGHQEEVPFKMELVIKTGLINQGLLVSKQWERFERNAKDIGSDEEKKRVLHEIGDIMRTATTNLYPYCEKDAEIEELWKTLVQSHMEMISMDGHSHWNPGASKLL